MKIRLRCESTFRSFHTIKDIEPTAEAIADYLRPEFDRFDIDINPEKITLRHIGLDYLLNWDTYLVELNGNAVAYTNESITKGLKDGNSCNQ